MGSKKTSVSISIEKPELKSVDQKADMSVIEAAKKESEKKEERKAPCYVISRLNRPEKFKYDGKEIRVSPRAKLRFGNIDKVGDLPKGLVKRPLKIEKKKE